MREPALFAAVGGLQYLLDAAIYTILLALGAPIPAANVSARACAAVCGFALNRYVTFGKRDDSVGLALASLGRFVLLFCVMTLASTLALMMLDNPSDPGLSRNVAHKMGVEAVLAVVSFLVSKYWVFRR